jgi:hypothetical protein
MIGTGAHASPQSAQRSGAPSVTMPAGYRSTVFAAGSKLSKPDDITTLAGRVFVAYQNGVGPNGEPSSTGQKASTVVEYTPKGAQVASWNLTGKIDGMTADPITRRIIATVNEDGNSGLSTIRPRGNGGIVTHYRYNPSPLPHGGGTDSPAIVNGGLYISASNPSPNADGKTYSRTALYKVCLMGHTATATPVFKDNSAATSASTGKQTTLNLSDPDSTERMPATAPRFAGDLLLDSQGDSEQIYLSNPGTIAQSATVLKLNTQVDDTAIATTRKGILYVTDNGSNRVIAITGRFHTGQVFTAVPKDSKPLAGTVGSLNLKTGTVTPFGKGFSSPQGLVFKPSAG